jgi:multicomponent Na+:H+ antiporter subunit D
LSSWLVYVAGTTVVVASLVALTKDNLKARLAYSTISQLAYIVLGAALANGLGVIGGSMHIATHAVGKITLFFCAGAILVAAHKSEVSQMRGIGRQMPLTMFAFLIGSLSIIGLPPFAGAWSKWYLVLGAFEARQYFAVGVLVFSSLLNIAYLLPVAVNAFFVGEGADDKGGDPRSSAGLSAAIAVDRSGLSGPLPLSGPGARPGSFDRDPVTWKSNTCSTTRKTSNASFASSS